MIENVYVYVQALDGTPLMPTTRYGKVRRMLRNNKAKVVSRIPFTIRLTYEPVTKETQPITLGIDTGRTNIGFAAVKDNGICVYRAKVTTRNKEIPKLMERRRGYRRASRYGERCRRKRRARKHNTTMKHKIKNRHLPTFKATVIVKDIINTESKFINKKRPKKWLPPTAMHLLNTHLSMIKKISATLPITYVCIEITKFSFMAMDNPGVKKRNIDFQHGPLYGYSGINEAVYDMQGGLCLLCGKHHIDHYHHMLQKSKYGSDTYANIVGLCIVCHEKVHKNEHSKQTLDKLHAKRNRKYSASSILNQITPSLVKSVNAIFPDRVCITYGYYTKQIRSHFGLTKSHDIDAYCIAIQGFDNDNIKADDLLPSLYEIVQFRRQNRSLIHHQTERIYKHDGIIVAKNRRKRTDQLTNSLHEWYLETKKLYGKEEARKIQSKLVIFKSKRAYNNMNRILPGAVFDVCNKKYVLKGQQDRGEYYITYGQNSKKFRSKECKIVALNSGLVYVT